MNSRRGTSTAGEGGAVSKRRRGRFENNAGGTWLGAAQKRARKGCGWMREGGGAGAQEWEGGGVEASRGASGGCGGPLQIAWGLNTWLSPDACLYTCDVLGGCLKT